MLRGGNKYYRLFLFIIFVVGLNLALPRQVFCYDTDIAHPGIAELAVKLYNKNNTNKVSVEQMSWIKQGAVDEDTPTRWTNHFYDPIYNRGLWLGNQHDSAKVWAKNPVGQQEFSVGDNSWQRAINDFQASKYEQAYKELGHNIHLVSDMLVPAHTRDSIHVLPPDSYEQYVKNNWDAVKPDVKNISDQYSIKNKLEDIFDEAAKYSNGSFYSDNTIEKQKYKINVIENYIPIKTSDGDKFIAQNKVIDKLNNLYITDSYDWNLDGKKIVNDSVILSSYASHLLPKAVGYSANTIKLFLDETQKNQKEKVPFFRIGLGGVLNSGLGAIVSIGQNMLSSAQSQSPTDQIAAVPNQIDVNSVLDNLVSQATKIVSVTPVVTPPISQSTSPIISPTPAQTIPPPQAIVDNNQNKVSTPTLIYSGIGSVVVNNPIINLIVQENAPTSTDSSTLNTNTSTESISTSTITTTPPTSTEEITTSTTTSTPDITTSTEPIVSSTPENTTSTTSTFETSTTTTSTPAEPAPDVVINEIAWAGTSQFTTEDQYIELYNNTNQDIILFPKGDATKWWKLKFGNREISINKIINNTIPAHGYYLFETPDDRTVNEISADIIFNATFKKTGEDVQLLDSNGRIVDEVDNSAGWFAGSASDYTSMEKINSATSGNKKTNWQSNQGPRFDGKVDGGGDGIPLYGSPKQSNFGSIVLKATQTETERTIKKSDYPYLLTYYEIPFGKTLNIDPGVIIKTVYPDSKIDIKGALNINGEANNKVTITSDKSQPKSWQGLMFYSGAVGKILDTDINYAGNSFRLPGAGMWDPRVSYGIYSDSSNLTINGVNIVDSGDTNIYTKNSTVNISNSNFKNGTTAIEHYDGALTLNNLSVDNFSNSSGAIFVKNIWPQLNKINFTNNTNGAVDIVLASITSSIEINPDSPVTFGNLTIEREGSLTASKGTIFNLPQYSNIFVKGTLNLNGTDSEPIKFVGLSGKSFGQLVFDGGIGNLNSVNFLNGGYYSSNDNSQGVVSLKNNSQVTMKNCRLMDNKISSQVISINNSALTLNNSSLGYTNKDTYFSTLKGIQLNSGTLSLDNSNFYNLTSGITAGPVDPLPQLNLINMDPRNFINVDAYWDPIGWLPGFNISTST